MNLDNYIYEKKQYLSKYIKLSIHSFFDTALKIFDYDPDLSFEQDQNNNEMIKLAESREYIWEFDGAYAENQSYLKRISKKLYKKVAIYFLLDSELIPIPANSISLNNNTLGQSFTKKIKYNASKVCINKIISYENALIELNKITIIKAKKNINGDAIKINRFCKKLYYTVKEKLFGQQKRNKLKKYTAFVSKSYFMEKLYYY